MHLIYSFFHVFTFSRYQSSLILKINKIKERDSVCVVENRCSARARNCITACGSTWRHIELT